MSQPSAGTSATITAPAVLGRFSRFAIWLLAAILLAGFWSPFPAISGSGAGSAWLFLAGLTARNTSISIDIASIAIVATALFLALAAALLRTWTSAVGGRSNHVRAAAYWMHALALAILMRPAGALFTAVATTAVCGALAWLPAEIGPAPRLGWLRGLARELYFWGVVLTYAMFATRYNTTLMEQGVLVSLGVGIIVRQLVVPPVELAAA
jgi:hypothetical protein